MTQQVMYDTASGAVLQWQDTEQFNYAAMPSTASVLSVTSAEWSNQAGNWWVVSGALTQTNPNAPTAAQLLSQAQSAQNATLKQSCKTAIGAGYPFTSSTGNAYTITTSITDQLNGNGAALIAQGVITRATTWAASTAYAANSVVLAGGNYYLCAQAGNSGAAAPTFPTAFSTPVTDGTCAWKLFGLLVPTTTGKVWMTAQNIIACYSAGALFIATQLATLATLEAKVSAATTVADVQAIVWP